MGCRDFGNEGGRGKAVGEHRRGEGVSSHLCSFCCLPWPCPGVEQATYGTPSAGQVERAARAIWPLLYPPTMGTRRNYDGCGQCERELAHARQVAAAALSSLAGEEQHRA